MEPYNKKGGRRSRKYPMFLPVHMRTVTQHNFCKAIHSYFTSNLSVYEARCFATLLLSCHELQCTLYNVLTHLFCIFLDPQRSLSSISSILLGHTLFWPGPLLSPKVSILVLLAAWNTHLLRPFVVATMMFLPTVSELVPKLKTQWLSPDE